MRGNLLIQSKKTATLRTRRKGCEQDTSHFSQRVTKHQAGWGQRVGLKLEDVQWHEEHHTGSLTTPLLDTDQPWAQYTPVSGLPHLSPFPWSYHHMTNPSVLLTLLLWKGTGLKVLSRCGWAGWYHAGPTLASHHPAVLRRKACFLMA